MATALTGGMKLFSALDNPLNPYADNCRGFDTVGSTNEMGSDTEDCPLLPRFVGALVADAVAEAFNDASIFYDGEFDSNGFQALQSGLLAGPGGVPSRVQRLSGSGQLSFRVYPHDQPHTS